MAANPRAVAGVLVPLPDLLNASSGIEPAPAKGRFGVRGACLALALVLALPGTVQAQLSLSGLGGTSGDAAQDASEDDASGTNPENEQQVTEARQELESVESKIRQLQERIAGADERIRRIQEKIANDHDLIGAASTDINDLSREALEELVSEQRNKVSAQRERIVELDATLSDLIQAPSKLAEQREAISQETAQTPALPQAGAPSAASDAGPASGVEAVPSGDAADSAATVDGLRRQIDERRLELTRLRLSNNETLNALTTAERDLAKRELAQRETFLDRALERLRVLSEREAEQSLNEAREAQRQSAFEPKVVRSLADEIVALKEELASASHRGGQVAEQLQEVSSRFDRIRDDFITTRDRVEVVGSTPAIGRMLRRRLDSLPSNTGYRRSAQSRRAEISEVIDRQIDIDEELRQLGEVDAEVTNLMAGIGEPVASEHIPSLRERLASLLVEKRNTLSQLHAQYGAVAARLTQLDQAQRDLVSKAREFVEFIEGELMTIPSQPVLHEVTAGQWLAAVSSSFDMRVWKQLVTDTATALTGSIDFTVLVLLLTGAVLASRRWARREFKRIAPLTRKIRTDRMALTFLALVCTLLLCASMPILLGGLGWVIVRASVSDISSAFGSALMLAGAVLLIFGFVRQMVRTDGLALRHFRWTEDSCRRIYRNLYWFLPLLTVSVGFNRFTFLAGVEGWNLFSRLFLIAMLVLTLVFFWRVSRHALSSEKHVDALTDLSDPLSHRRRRWFLPLALVLWSVAFMSYFGYHYTAMRLDYYIGQTFVLLVALLLAHNLLLRWSTLVQKRLRFNELVKRREEARASRESGESESQAPDSADYLVVDEHELDVVGLGEQTQRLVSAVLLFLGFVGLYLVWDDLFPALRVLNEINLPFSQLAVVDGVQKEIPVTLTDVAVALLVFVATFIAARNLPGLLEFVVLQRLPIDAGARYATITIARYVIVAVGVIVGFGIIGADWSKLQWLIAALGVGLGFGLQEIVANFVSGIILLFERPIRVGDVITLGDTDGVVTRIRIRATTIRNWDQRELVVPNKEFITGRLLNWTLSDPINRMVIKVGVAYGSDVDKALEIMLDVAEKHPHVLEDPKPVVVFENFGESSLDLSLRCYQTGLDWRLPTLNEINREINRRFAEAGIEIPFAQRDVHLRAGDPLEVVLRRGQRAPD